MRREGDNLEIILQGKIEGKRGRGRQKRRYADTIKALSGCGSMVGAMRLAENQLTIFSYFMRIENTSYFNVRQLNQIEICKFAEKGFSKLHHLVAADQTNEYDAIMKYGKSEVKTRLSLKVLADTLEDERKTTEDQDAQIRKMAEANPFTNAVKIQEPVAPNDRQNIYETTRSGHPPHQPPQPPNTATYHTQLITQPPTTTQPPTPKRHTQRHNPTATTQPPTTNRPPPNAPPPTDHHPTAHHPTAHTKPPTPNRPPPDTPTYSAHPAHPTSTQPPPTTYTHPPNTQPATPNLQPPTRLHPTITHLHPATLNRSRAPSDTQPASHT
ncbi:uncharacterized protein LOC134775801 [Penaeus indicus]|uniref:uncharacterized protein LOC134775801 n=1 Tax=Penaeus indicus TaxID=29960 RepID=UPI00300C6C53